MVQSSASGLRDVWKRPGLESLEPQFDEIEDYQDDHDRVDEIENSTETEPCFLISSRKESSTRTRRLKFPSS